MYMGWTDPRCCVSTGDPGGFATMCVSVAILPSASVHVLVIVRNGGIVVDTDPSSESVMMTSTGVSNVEIGAIVTVVLVVCRTPLSCRTVVTAHSQMNTDVEAYRVPENRRKAPRNRKRGQVTGIEKTREW